MLLPAALAAVVFLSWTMVMSRWTLRILAPLVLLAPLAGSAEAAVGDGAVSARTTRPTSIPSHQRASDSHDYTRLGDVESIERLVR